MRDGLAGSTQSARRHLRRCGGQLRGLLERRHPRRGLPLRRRRSDPRDRALRSPRRRPGTSGTATCRGCAPGSSTACACTGRTSRSTGTAATPTSCWSIRTPRRSAARSTGRRRCSATGRRRRRDGAARPGVDERDSAAGVPKGVVVDDFFDWGDDRPPRDPLAQDRHLRAAREGLHQAAPGDPRGAARHLRRPGPPGRHRAPQSWGSPRSSCCRCTSPPTTASSRTSSLRNYWGYSTLGFFAPEQRYASRVRPGAQVTEFKAMVKALHAAGIEVILDVVYNHTCEGNHLGPDAVAAGHRQRHLLLADAGARATTWTSPAPATASTPPTRRRRASSSTRCATG